MILTLVPESTQCPHLLHLRNPMKTSAAKVNTRDDRYPTLCKLLTVVALFALLLGVGAAHGSSDKSRPPSDWEMKEAYSRLGLGLLGANASRPQVTLAWRSLIKETFGKVDPPSVKATYEVNAAYGTIKSGREQGVDWEPHTVASRPEPSPSANSYQARPPRPPTAEELRRSEEELSRTRERMAQDYQFYTSASDFLRRPPSQGGMGMDWHSAIDWATKNLKPGAQSWFKDYSEKFQLLVPWMLQPATTGGLGLSTQEAVERADKLARKDWSFAEIRDYILREQNDIFSKGSSKTCSGLVGGIEQEKD
jgi:hypothetical protein